MRIAEIERETYLWAVETGADIIFKCVSCRPVHRQVQEGV